MGSKLSPPTWRGILASTAAAGAIAVIVNLIQVVQGVTSPAIPRGAMLRRCCWSMVGPRPGIDGAC